MMFEMHLGTGMTREQALEVIEVVGVREPDGTVKMSLMCDRDDYAQQLADIFSIAGYDLVGIDEEDDVESPDPEKPWLTTRFTLWGKEKNRGN